MLLGLLAASQGVDPGATMDGAFPSAKGEGFDTSAEFSEQRKGFRGNAENAKTKLCMRWVRRARARGREAL